MIEKYINNHSSNNNHIVDLPGQENDAEMYPGQYPTIQELGENLLPRILDDLKVPLVVGLGEGAGANILVRFALRHPQRCLGKFYAFVHFYFDFFKKF